MEESTSKEKVLKAVREALISKTDQPFPKIDYEKPVFREMEEPEDVNFAQELTAAGGEFLYCADEQEAAEGLRYLMTERQWKSLYATEPQVIQLLTRFDIPFEHSPEQLTSARSGVTGCEFLIARLGSVMVSSGQMAGRRIYVFPDVHIVIAPASRLVPDLRDAISKLRKKYEQRMPSMVSVITGPSRTADIEKTLVMGAHGPRELIVFLLEDRN